MLTTNLTQTTELALKAVNKLTRRVYFQRINQPKRGPHSMRHPYTLAEAKKAYRRYEKEINSTF